MAGRAWCLVLVLSGVQCRNRPGSLPIALTPGVAICATSPPCFNRIPQLQWRSPSPASAPLLPFACSLAGLPAFSSWRFALPAFSIGDAIEAAKEEQKKAEQSKSKAKQSKAKAKKAKDRGDPKHRAQSEGHAARCDALAVLSLRPLAAAARRSSMQRNAAGWRAAKVPARHGKQLGTGSSRT